MKKLLLSLIFCSLISFGIATQSQATSIFMDFDSAGFSPDGPGDFAHTYSTVLGDVHFNGRIWNGLNFANTPDHTTGTGFFLKNTTVQDKITMTFDFPVTSLSLYVRTADVNVVVLGEAFDGSNVLLDSGVFDVNSQGWAFNDAAFASPIAKLTIFSNSPQTGNNFAIDDITLNSVPEPMTLSLLGAGIMGLAGLRRKKA